MSADTLIFGEGALGQGSLVVRTLANDRAQVGRLVQQLGDVAAAVGERGTAVMQLGRQGLDADERQPLEA